MWKSCLHFHLVMFSSCVFIYSGLTRSVWDCARQSSSDPRHRIWYSPYGRVGEPCRRGAQIPCNGKARKGKRARNMSRNRPCEGFHLEGIKKNLSSLWEGRVKEYRVWEKKEREERTTGRRGASGGDHRRLTASSGTSLDSVSSLYFDASLKFWFVAVQTLFMIWL